MRGRDFFWFDLQEKLRSIDDRVFRAQHPGIRGAEWAQLLSAALGRAEKLFKAMWHEEHPGEPCP